jgi:IclR family acetate operon transcriptional repressor
MTRVHPLARTPERQASDGRLAGVDRVLAALRLLGNYPDGATLDQLARALGAPKSSAHRALAALRRAGLAEQDAQGRYRLGLELVRLAFAHYEEREDYRLVEPTLQALAARFKETAHFAVLDGAEVVYVAKVNPIDRRVQMTSTVGGRNPAHCTGVGKALLAWALPDDESVRGFVDEHGPLARRTANTLVTAEELAPELAATRQRGFALDREESEVGIGCVAFPVFLSSPSRPSGAVSVSALLHLSSLDSLEASAPNIREVIHAHLGQVTP